VLLTAAAFATWHLTPVSTLSYSVAAVRYPFDVHMAVGEPARGRTVIAEVEQVAGAGEVDTGDEVLGGTWVVVDLVLDATGADPRTSLDLAELVIGAATYTPTERLAGTLDGSTVAAGLPRRGSIVFEIPADTAHGSARLRIGDDPLVRLGDRLVLDIDLDELDFDGTVVVEPAAYAEAAG